MLFWNSLCYLIPTQETVLHLHYWNNNIVTETEVSVMTSKVQVVLFYINVKKKKVNYLTVPLIS